MRFKWLFVSTLLFFVSTSFFAQPTLFTPTGSGGGGYMYSPSINPKNPSEMWINCDMGGVYKTINSGLSWSLIPYTQQVSTVKGKIQYTNDPDILYVVNRSQDPNHTPWYQGRTMKSIDGAKTWTDIDPTISGTHRLFVDPNDANRIILNEYNALFISQDGGLTFQQIEIPAWDLVWLAGVYWDGNDVWLATGNGLLYSDNGGSDFNVIDIPELENSEGIYQMTGAKQNDIATLFLVTAEKELLLPWHEVLEIQDGLKNVYSFQPKTLNLKNIKNNIPNDANIAWLESASNNTDIIWASGDINDLPVIYKSIDGGNNWENTFNVEGNSNISTGWAGEYGIVSMYWSGGMLGIDVNDQDPNHVITTSGFAYQTKDGGLTWEQQYVDVSTENLPTLPSAQDKVYRSSGLDVTTSHDLLWIGQDTILASCTDIGNQYSVDGGLSWSFNLNIRSPWNNLTWPNWYRVIKHPNTGRLYAALSELNDIYLGYRLTDEGANGQGMIAYSDNSGMRWDTLYNFGHGVVWLEMSVLNADILYASVVHQDEGGIYRSTDGGKTWTKLYIDARTEGHPYTIRCLKDGSVVVTFSARAPENTNNLSASSGVFWSANGIDNWQDVSSQEMRYYTKDIVIDPHDPSENTWYVTVWGRFNVFSGGNSEGLGGVYRTNNRGSSWHRIMDVDLAESIAIHPDVPDIAYVAIENNGIFVTENLTENEPVFTPVKSFPFWRPKRIFWDPFSESRKRKLWVTTMGGGMWYGQEDFTNNTRENLINSDLSVYPNPVSDLLNLKIENSSTILEWELLNTSGQSLKKGILMQSTEINTSDLANGFYVLKVKGKGVFRIIKLD